MRKIFVRYSPWLLMLLSVDGFAVLLLWLSDAERFSVLIGTILLFSLIFFSVVALLMGCREHKKQQYFQAFLSDPQPVNEARLLRVVSGQEREQLQLLSAVLRDSQVKQKKLAEDVRDYEEYVEAWVHEAKTPLSLLVMLLDNRGDELPVQLREKLDYVRSQLQEDVTQILYYARLKSSTKDYRFEAVRLCDVLDEVLEDYAPLLAEKEFVIQSDVGDTVVFTDHRGLRFMLAQVISNSIKYSGETAMLTISAEQRAKETFLTIADRGTGVKSYDLPYVFQKGFTGDSTDSRRKATGMGLYLTKKMADDLHLKLDAESEWGQGFAIAIQFPNVLPTESVFKE